MAAGQYPLGPDGRGGVGGLGRDWVKRRGHSAASEQRKLSLLSQHPVSKRVEVSYPGGVHVAWLCTSAQHVPLPMTFNACGLPTGATTT